MNELPPLEDPPEEFQQRVAEMDEAKAKWLLVQMYAEMLMRGNYYREQLRQQWGMGDSLSQGEQRRI